MLPLLLLAPLAASPTRAPQDEQDDAKPRVAVRVPQLISVFPLGAAPGSTTQVELRGDYLEGTDSVRFTTSDVSATVKKSSLGRVDAEIKVSPGAGTGPRYFRVVSPRGASNLLMFRVSAWPSTGETEPNNELREAAAVSWPVIVHARLQNQRDVDLFRFHAARGQPIDLHVLGARSWSAADLSLALLDTEGRALATDEGSFIWDPYLHFIPPRDGDFIAAVMLTRMPAGGQSGGDLVYQLAIGRAPLALSASPIYLRAGGPARLEIRGESLGAVSEWTSDLGNFTPETVSENRVVLAGQIAAAAAAGPHLVRMRHPAGFAAPVTLLVGSDPAISESRENDDPRNPESIPIPVVVNGRIETNQDRDCYRFDVEAGDALVFRIDAEKLGSRLDARLELLDSAGKVLAANDDAKNPRGTLRWDPELEYTFKAAGACVIRVSSQQRRGGPDYVYALAAHKRRPDFRLSLAAERLVLGRGDTASWSCAVQREEGFDGEVRIEAAGLPPGVEARPLTLAADKTSGKLELIAKPDAPFGAARIEIAGRATIGGQEVCRTAAVPAARISGSGPGFESYASTEAWLTVIDAPLFSFEPAVSEVFVARGATAELGLKVARRRRFDGGIEFTLDGAPEGLAVENSEVIDQGRMVRLTLRATEKARPGRASVRIMGTAAGSRRLEPGPGVTIQVN